MVGTWWSRSSGSYPFEHLDHRKRNEIGSDLLPRTVTPILGLLSAALLAYATVRAHTVSFTYDECFTFLEHVRKGLFYQDRFDEMGANHHLLNVWLMWLCWKFFGDGEFALRLPSLFAYGLYLYATYRIALRSSSMLFAVGAFLALNLHPYLVDFFSLARGYALGNAFLMLSLWQATSYLQDGRKRRTLVRAAVLAALAAISHIILINYLLAFCGALTILLVIGQWRGGPPSYQPFVLIASIAALGLLITLPNALGLFHGGSLYFGCDQLWSCSLRSLAEKILYHQPFGEPPLVILELALRLCGVAWLVSALMAWYFGPWRSMVPSLFGLLTLGLCVLAFILQHALLGVPYPLTRTGVFLLPIVAFSIVMAVQTWRWRKAAGSAMLAGCVPLLYLSHASFNLRYVVEWKAASEIRRALDVIASDHVPLSDARPAILVRTGFETGGAMRYHVLSRQWHWLAHGVRRDTLFPAADYYLVEYDAHHLVDTVNWTRLFLTEATGLAVYRDERFRNGLNDIVHESSYIGASHAEGRLPVIEWVVPQNWTPGPVLIAGSLRTTEENDRNWVGLLIEVSRNGEVVLSEGRSTLEQIPTYGEEHDTHVVMCVPEALLPGDRVRFTTWPCFDEPRIILGEATLRVMR